MEECMPAYWIARSRIVDPVAYKKYTDPVPAIIARHGGKVLARGGRFQVMEGPDKFHRPLFRFNSGSLAAGVQSRELVVAQCRIAARWHLHHPV